MAWAGLVKKSQTAPKGGRGGAGPGNLTKWEVCG